MLKTFLKDNKISLTKLTSPPKNIPTTHPLTSHHHYYYDEPEKRQPMSEPIIPAAKSPNYKRRPIFEKISSPQSKLTADFGQIPNFSTVQSYQIPQPERAPTPAKKKVKTNKENGLCIDRQLSRELQKEISKKSLHTFSDIRQIVMPQANDHLAEFIKGQSVRQRRVEELQSFNRQLQRELLEESRRRKQEGSLEIVEPPSSNFTFQSSRPSVLSPQSSLTYSSSKWQQESLHLTLQSPNTILSPFHLQ